MLNTLERFPQLGGINDFLALPPNERALYRQYSLYQIKEEAKAPVLKMK